MGRGVLRLPLAVPADSNASARWKFRPQRADDVPEDVVVRTAAEEEVQVRVAGHLDERVAARLQAVEPRERELLAARQEAAVGRSGQEGPAWPIAGRAGDDVVGKLVEAVDGHEVPGLRAARHLAEEGGRHPAELARQ